MEKEKKILFSIDLEEFDIPEEYGEKVPMKTKMETSRQGMEKLYRMIEEEGITATVFTTGFWAEQYPEFVRKIAEDHEIASHTYYHDSFQTTDLERSRSSLETITGKSVHGLRMPRMREINNADVLRAGYVYNSSLHPTWLPGRYNNLRRQRIVHQEAGVWQIPVSVTPSLRIPLFWLMFKNCPPTIYRRMIERVIDRDGYFVFYVHPWEFTDLRMYRLPAYVKRIDGEQLLDRLRSLIRHLQRDASFITHTRFIREFHVRCQ